jgi:Uncharacterized protein conserved in bacteria
MSDPKNIKPLPRFSSDAEAEDFVANSDLSGGQRSGYEFKTKDTTISMRVSRDLLDAIKARAAVDGMPYQRFIRQALEKAIGTDGHKAG